MLIYGQEDSDILTYTQEDWQPLFDLIPIIEKQDEFVRVHPSENIRDNVFTAPFVENLQVIDDFHHICYGLPIVMVFDWMTWKEGADILNNPEKRAEIGTLDIFTLCKLITFALREERFCDGALGTYFKSGVILDILYAIKAKVENMNNG